LKPPDMANNSSRNTSFLTILTWMACHPPFPLMEFWSLKPQRSKQEGKVFPLDPIFLAAVAALYRTMSVGLSVGRSVGR